MRRKSFVLLIIEICGNCFNTEKVIKRVKYIKYIKTSFNKVDRLTIRVLRKNACLFFRKIGVIITYREASNLFIAKRQDCLCLKVLNLTLKRSNQSGRGYGIRIAFILLT